MQGYKNCWKFYTIYTMIYKKCQIEVNGEKLYVEKNIFFVLIFCVQNEICLGVLSWREGSAEEMFFF